MGARYSTSASTKSAYFYNTRLLDPTLFGRCLKDMEFPAGKKQLLAHAQAQNAPKNVLFILSKFSNRRYRNVVDLFKEFWTVI